MMKLWLRNNALDITTDGCRSILGALVKGFRLLPLKS
jgi:hypothetical protein